MELRPEDLLDLQDEGAILARFPVTAEVQAFILKEPKAPFHVAFFF